MRIPGVNNSQGLAVHEMKLLLPLCLSVLDGVKCSWIHHKPEHLCLLLRAGDCPAWPVQEIVFVWPAQHPEVHSKAEVMARQEGNKMRQEWSFRYCHPSLGKHCLDTRRDFWDNTSAVLYTHWGERCLANFIFCKPSTASGESKLLWQGLV